MTNKWRINGTDIYATLGIAIKQGSYLELMSPPTPRKRLEHDFVDANGSSVDLTNELTYEPRRFSIKAIITAADYSQYWARYNALLAIIAVPGTFSLWVQDIGMTCTLLYEGMKCTAKPRSLRSGRIVVEFEIAVLEPNPTNRTYAN